MIEFNFLVDFWGAADENGQFMPIRFLFYITLMMKT